MGNSPQRIKHQQRGDPAISKPIATSLAPSSPPSAYVNGIPIAPPMEATSSSWASGPKLRPPPPPPPSSRPVNVTKTNFLLNFTSSNTVPRAPALDDVAVPILGIDDIKRLAADEQISLGKDVLLEIKSAWFPYEVVHIILGYCGSRADHLGAIRDTTSRKLRPVKTVDKSEPRFRSDRPTAAPLIPFVSYIRRPMVMLDDDDDNNNDDDDDWD